LDVAVETLLLARATNPNGNKLPNKGVMNDILASLKQQGVTNASRDMVYNHMKKLERQQLQKKQQQQHNDPRTTTTIAAAASQQQQQQRAMLETRNEKNSQQQQTAKKATLQPTTGRENSDDEHESDKELEPTPKTTACSTRTPQNQSQNQNASPPPPPDQSKKIVAATSKAAVLFMVACQKNQAEAEDSQKDKHSMLNEVLRQVEEEFDLPHDLIDRQTVCESTGEPVPIPTIVEEPQEEQQEEEKEEKSQKEQEEKEQTQPHQQGDAAATGANATSNNDDNKNKNDSNNAQPQQPDTGTTGANATSNNICSNNNNGNNGQAIVIPMQRQNNNTNGQPMALPMQMQQMQMAMAAFNNNNGRGPICMMGPGGQQVPMMMFGPTPQGFPGFCRPFQTAPQPMMPGMIQPFQPQGFTTMQQLNAAAAARFMTMMNNNNNNNQMQGMNMMTNNNNNQMQCMMMMMMMAAANQTQQTNAAASGGDQEKEEEDQQKKIEKATNRAAVLLLVQQSSITSPYKRKTGSHDDSDSDDHNIQRKKPSLNEICNVVQQVEQEFGLPANTIDKDKLVNRIHVCDSDDDSNDDMNVDGLSRSKRGKRNRTSGKHKRKLPGQGLSADEDSEDGDDDGDGGGRARKRRSTCASPRKRAAAKEAAKQKRQEKAAERAARKEQEAAEREAKAEAAAMEQAEKEAETATAREYAQKVAAACDRATELFLPIFRESRAHNVQSPKGSLPKIVREVEEEYGLEEGTILKDTIRGRVMAEFHKNKKANKTRTYNACMDSDGLKRNCGGRPKGSTAAARKFFKKKDSSDDGAMNRRRDKTFQAAMEKAATLYHEAVQKAKSQGLKCSAGTLEKIIQEIENEFDLPESTLNVWSIRTRVKRGSLTAKRESNTSPLEDLEPEIVEECIRMAKDGQHLLPGVVMKLATAIVQRDPGRVEAIIAWKKKNYKYTEGQALLGNGWYRGFLKRHGQEIQGNLGVENANSTGVIAPEASHD